MVVSQDGHVFLCFASCCSSLSYINLTADFTGEGGGVAAFWLSVFVSVFASVFQLFHIRSDHNFLLF